MLTEDRFKVIDLPPLTPDQLESFAALPFDPYTGGRQRYRRFSQYRLDSDGTSWTTTLLPHRPFIQPRSVNSLVGGIARAFEPLLIDPARQLAVGASELGLSTNHPWQANVHQCRVVVDDDIKGVSVPEGPHRDGHDFGMLAVWGRHGIEGGVSQLLPIGGGVPFFSTVLRPGQALVYDDAAMWHHATDITAPPGSAGHRDLWIIAFNRWDRRKYGDEFEASARASA